MTSVKQEAEWVPEPSNRFGYKKNISTLPGIETRIVQPTAQSLSTN
jgi:hypothetical protein